MTRPEKTALFIMGVVGWIIHSPVSLVKWFHTKLLKWGWYNGQWQKYLDAVRLREDKEVEALIRKHSPNFQKQYIDQIVEWYVPHRLTDRWRWCEAIRYKPDWYWTILLSGHMSQHMGHDNRIHFINRLIKENPTYEERVTYWQKMWAFYKEGKTV